MPRGRGGFQGNWATYADAAGAYEYPDDEEAVAQTLDEMLSMVGNAGQERLIGDGIEAFDHWAAGALEEAGFPYNTWEAFKGYMIANAFDGRDDKFLGSHIIWGVGFDNIARQSGYHDRYDEQGEGTGQEF